MDMQDKVRTAKKPDRSFQCISFAIEASNRISSTTPWTLAQTLYP